MSKNIIGETFKQFLIGGSFVAGISIISNYFDPIFGGLLAGIPIGLPTIYFIKKVNAHAYITNLSMTTILLCVTTILYYYLFVHIKWEKNTAIIPTMTFWFSAIIIIYLIEKIK